MSAAFRFLELLDVLSSTPPVLSFASLASTLIYTASLRNLLRNAGQNQSPSPAFPTRFPLRRHRGLRLLISQSHAMHPWPAAPPRSLGLPALTRNPVGNAGVCNSNECIRFLSFIGNSWNFVTMWVNPMELHQFRQSIEFPNAASFPYIKNRMQYPSIMR